MTAAASKAAPVGGQDPAGVRRQMRRLAGPIILANLGQPLMGMVDTTLSGHLEDPALIGSVAVGALIFSFLFWSFSFLRQATGGLTAQARGAADWTEVRAVLWRALLFALVLGVLLWALQDPAEWLALTLIGASQTVTEGAALYFSLRIWSAPATLTFYCLHGWLLGMQDTRSVMLLTLSLQGLNAGFSCLFVLVCDWGLAGVAVGTLLAEYLAVGLGWLLVRRHLQRHPAGPSATGLLEGRKLRALVLVNANLMVRTFALLFGIGIFTGTAAQFGDRTLAANNLLQQLFSLVAFALDGFADAAEAMVGYAKGVRNRLLASRTIVAALQMAALFSLPFSLTYGLFGAEILHLFTKHDEVAVTAETYLVWVIVLPLAGVWAFVFDGTFIGAMRTAALRNAMLVSLASFWGLQSLLVPLWGNHGLWLAFVGFILMRGIALAVALPRLLNAIDPRA